MKQSDSATTARFGLIGHPIARSLSPAIFTAAYSGKYPFDLIQTESFTEAWERFIRDYKAINVTSPFKVNAFQNADIISDEVKRCGASNLCVKTEDGIAAYNSDYRGVKALLEKYAPGTAAVIGFGGAGKAALAAVEELGFSTRLYRHDEIAGGVSADVIVYTLPKAVPEIDRLESEILLEANYKNPCLDQHKGYIGGKQWLLMQAVMGYELMTGEIPDKAAMESVLL